MVQVAMVGKPSAGKSTFFKAATLAEVDIANYPFTTIKPNHAVGFVRVNDPAREFDKVSDPRAGYVHGPYRFVSVDMIDVAGLVPGAHEGEGMGAQFLNDLNQADMLIHVIDVSGSTNGKGESVEQGSYDPANDIAFLEDELDHWYKNILAKQWEKFTRQTAQVKKEPFKAIAKQMSGLGVSEELAQEAIGKADLVGKKMGDWTQEELLSLARILRKATKPMIIAANKVDVPGGKENFERISAEFDEYPIIPMSAESELALREAHKHNLIEYIPGEGEFTITAPDKLSDKQKAALGFIKENLLDKFGSTGVQQVLNTAVFDVMEYKELYPGGVSKLEDSDGNVLPDCFLMPKETTALDFAYRLHSDFGDNFIKAIDVRSKRPVGKDAVLSRGDIIEIAAKK